MNKNPFHFALKEIGVKEITVIDASSISAGDELIIWDSTEAAWNSARANYYKGEFVTVDEVVGNTLKLKDTLYDAYSDLANLKVYKHTGKSLQVSGLSLLCEENGQQAFGLRANGVMGLQLDDIKTNSFSYTAIGVSRSRYININKVHSDMSRVNAGAGTNYCISIGNSQDATTTNSFLKSVRHGMSHGGGADIGSVITRNSKVSNCSVLCTTTVGAVDIHGCCENVVYDNNYIDGGCTLGGHRCSYINKKLYRRFCYKDSRTTKHGAHRKR